MAKRKSIIICVETFKKYREPLYIACNCPHHLRGHKVKVSPGSGYRAWVKGDTAIWEWAKSREEVMAALMWRIVRCNNMAVKGVEDVDSYPR